MLRNNDAVTIDHDLLEGSPCYGFTKFLNKFFRSRHHVLEIFVLNIAENYLLDSFLGNFLIPFKNNDFVENK